MTREEAKELLPIIQAWAKGKEIQFKACSGKWTDVEENDALNFEYSPSDYRIKPEPKYRPFKNQEECWQEMQKHQPLGWVKNECDNIFNIIAIFKESVKLNGCDTYYSKCCKQFKFIDGTPFGIKKE